MEWASIHKPLQFTSRCAYRLKSIIPFVDEEVADGYMDLDPEFQRGHVWTVEQQEAFIGHLVEGGAVQPIIFSILGDHSLGTRALLDGKQRLEAVRRFLSGDIAAHLSCDTRAHLDEFVDAELMTRAITLEVGFVHLSSDPAEAYQETLKLYLKLNSAGTPHSDEELAQVRGMVEGLS